MNALANMFATLPNVSNPLQRRNLQYTYRRPTADEDNRALRGQPDRSLLNRNEWYEVLHFINTFANHHGDGRAGVALKAETLIRFHLPGNLRSHENVNTWLLNNWTLYNV